MRFIQKHYKQKLFLKLIIKKKKLFFKKRLLQRYNRTYRNNRLYGVNKYTIQNNRRFKLLRYRFFIKKHREFIKKKKNIHYKLSLLTNTYVMGINFLSRLKIRRLRRLMRIPNRRFRHRK